jgi:hypothetical protein
VKPLMLIGALLTAFGIVALVAGGGMIEYSTHEKVPREGSTHLEGRREKVVSIPPLIAGLAIVGGLALMIQAARQ